MKAMVKNSEDGFALPSVLFLIVILSLLASSVITLEYFGYRLGRQSIDRVQADYAAQNGITSVLAAETQEVNNTLSSANNISFDDGSSAVISVMPWGVFSLIQSKGMVHSATATLLGLLGNAPSHQFDYALVLNNKTHQLIFSGSSSVKGNVLVGPYGAVTGSLPGVTTPRKIPVEGMVKSTSSEFNVFDGSLLKEQIALMNVVLRKTKKEAANDSHAMIIETNNGSPVSLQGIPDSIESVIVFGSAVIHTEITRREFPLNVIVHGSLVLQQGAIVQGLISLLSTTNVSIPPGVEIQDAILCSLTAINLEPGADVIGQLIAPKIIMQGTSRAEYPSVLVSIHVDDTSRVQQQVVLENGSLVEGTVMMLEATYNESSTDLINVAQGARVTGLIYSEGKVTFDGSMTGCLIAKDFYFYQAPTTYLGWLRAGTIDRSQLPKSFLMPAGFSSERGGVLDWL